MPLSYRLKLFTAQTIANVLPAFGLRILSDGNQRVTSDGSIRRVS